jgi:hypothetical protein
MSDLSDSLLRVGIILPTCDVAKDVAFWQTFISCKSYVVYTIKDLSVVVGVGVSVYHK